MDIKPIIVQQYLESLKEDAELDVLFPKLLQVMKFEILSTPKEYKGFSQYGKDIVAVGKDEGGIKTRYHFEIKAGNINGRNWDSGANSVRQSLTMTIDHEFETTYPKFRELPMKVVLAFNGFVKGKTRRQLNGFIKREFTDKGIAFEEWNISKLTDLFDTELFGAYLLTDSKTTRLFNRVMVNLNASEGISTDFVDLVNSILKKGKWNFNAKKIPRKGTLLFETLNLIAFMVYTEAKGYNNLAIAKRYLTHLVLWFWFWILKNKLEGHGQVIQYFARHLMFYHSILREYLNRTVPIALVKDGLSHHKAGRYDEIGYTQRTQEYLQTFCYVCNFERLLNPNFETKKAKNLLLDLINSNSVSRRVLLDIHSLSVMDVINLLLEFEDVKNARIFLKDVLGYIRYAKETYNRLPDANNSLNSVIKFTITGKMPIFYVDSTSPLLAVLLEYVALLKMPEEYEWLAKFVVEHDITLGIFVPHHGMDSNSREFIEDKENDLEEQLFSKSVKDGYQSEISVKEFPVGDVDFKGFQKKLEQRANEFSYDYRTDKSGFPMLRDLAHNYFGTPYFPDKWRSMLGNLPEHKD